MAATAIRPRDTGRLPLVGGLFQRLFIHHLLLVTVPIVALGILLVGITQRKINETLNQDGRVIAAQATNRIQEYISNVENILRTTKIGLEQSAALDPETGELDQQLASSFLNVALEDIALESFRHLYAVDSLGTLIAKTDFSVTELPAPGRAVADSVLAGGEFAVRELFPTELGLAPSLLMGVQLTNRLGENAGVLVGEVSAAKIWEVVDNIRVGERGRAFLVNQEGIVLAHRNKDLIYNKQNFSSLRSVGRALSAPGVGLLEDPEPADPNDPDSEQMSAAYAPIFSANLRWGLVLHRPVAEMNQTEDDMRIQVLVVILIGIALALISTLVYTRRLVTPIGALVEGANRLSQGDLTYKIPVVGHDEFGTLATEFNLMAEQISQIQQRLRRVEHLDTLAKFSSVVSHEIRNPLNAMQINLHLLQERLEPGDQEYLDVISNEIHRLENLVREFQTISRPPALSPQRTDVNALLTDVVNLQRGTASSQGVRIVTDLDPDLAHVEIDRNRITQAVLNVVLNSLQSMPEGGELLVCTRNLEEDTGWIAIEVSDTGEGISEEDLPHVFDFYYTSRDSGSGLGLSIAYRIIVEHGGQIALESEVGEGTIVLITLPPVPPEGASSTEYAP